MDALTKLDKVGLARPGPRHDPLMRLEKALDHLDAALLSSAILAELAQVVGMSPFDLARHFKSVLVSPNAVSPPHPDEARGAAPVQWRDHAGGSR